MHSSLRENKVNKFDKSTNYSALHQTQAEVCSSDITESVRDHDKTSRPRLSYA